MGTWFADLTDGTKSECLYHFSALILAPLQQKSIGLSGPSTLDFLITGTHDGYFALYQLAQLGRHPLLKPFTTVLHEPIQSMDNELAAYLAHWIQYLTAQALSGCLIGSLLSNLLLAYMLCCILALVLTWNIILTILVMIIAHSLLISCRLTCGYGYSSAPNLLVFMVKFCTMRCSMELKCPTNCVFHSAT